MYHGVTKTAIESSVMALKAGCDLNCGNIYLYLLKAVQDGLVTEDYIDRAAAQEHIDGILYTWYPGARGGSRIAKTLFGESSPSGKLPITLYKDLNDLATFEDYSMNCRTYRYFDGEVLYPFGYGLTYGNCNLITAEYKDGCIIAEIVNESDMDIEEVIQVYVKNLDSIHAVRNHSLCAFKRIALKKREVQQVKIPISEEEFLLVNEEGKYVSEGKSFKLFVGFGQPDQRTLLLTQKKCFEISVTK